MKIDIESPAGVAKDWIVSYARDKLMALHRREKLLTEARVVFKKAETISAYDKVCEITLCIYGDLISIHQNANTYELAAYDALDEMERKVDERIKRKKEPPEELT